MRDVSVGNVRPASGHAFSVCAGGCRADIAAVGASLRRLQVDGRDLVLGYAADVVRPHYRGAVLAPWPNRVIDGRWGWNGDQQRLALNEPERGNALHGLVAWDEWRPTEVHEDSVTLTTTVWPRPGYPFLLDLEICWTVDADGVTAVLTATGSGSTLAPYGCAIHPYLVAPTGPLESWVLHVPAHSQLLTDERKVPTHVAPVAASHDFTTPRAIGNCVLDDAFTDIDFDESGSSAVTLVGGDGRGTRIELHRNTPWLQIYTSDDVDGDGHRAAVAVEPMTCPPGALASGTDLALIAPGESHETRWRIAAIG